MNTSAASPIGPREHHDPRNASFGRRSGAGQASDLSAVLSPRHREGIAANTLQFGNGRGFS